MIRTLSAVTVVLVATAAWGVTSATRLTAAPLSSADVQATAAPHVRPQAPGTERPSSTSPLQPRHTLAPSLTPKATAPPEPIPVPTPVSKRGPSPFVTVCGSGLCVDDAPFRERGATAYGQYSDPVSEVALARRADLNTLELVEFDTRYHTLSDTESSATWDRVRRLHCGGPSRRAPCRPQPERVWPVAAGCGKAAGHDRLGAVPQLHRRPRQYRDRCQVRQRPDDCHGRAVG